MGMDVYYCSQYWENTDWVYFINQDCHFLGGRNVIEIVLDGEQIIKEAHSPVVEKLCTFSSDSEHEKIFSTYLRQKKVSRDLLMNEPVRNVPLIPYGIDETNSVKVKAKKML